VQSTKFLAGYQSLIIFHRNLNNLIQQKEYQTPLSVALRRSIIPIILSLNLVMFCNNSPFSASPFFFSPWLACDHNCDPVLTIWVLIRSVETSGSGDLEVSLFRTSQRHRTTNYRTREEWWIYGPHSLLRSMMDQSFEDSIFGGF